MQEINNIGEVGPKSIRIGGMKLDQLPIAEAAHAKFQMPDVARTEIQNKIEIILAKYPRPRVDYVKSRITECQENIVRVQKTKVEQDEMIRDYNGHISLCEFRDKEIAKLDPKADKAAIKDLRLRFPPYNVAALQQQIVQCGESKQRCDDVIQQENDSIHEFSEALGLCEQRDRELRQYGYKVA